MEKAMEKATQVFMDYATAFEQTYVDDDWSRLEGYFSKDAVYEVSGGPLACKITGRDAILKGLKKSIDGLDRRCADRQIDITEEPQISASGNGHEMSVGWLASYEYGAAPKLLFPGRSIVTVTDGVIVALRDEYDDQEMEKVGAWMLKYGEGLDGSYV